MTEDSRLALLGGGRMGQAIVSGLLAGGWQAESICVVEPDPTTADHLRADLGVAVADLAEALAGATLGVVAVKPHQVVGLLDVASPHLGPGVTVVSIAAGVTTSKLAEHLPPGTAIVRVMPNTPALVGRGMSVMSPAPGCPPESAALAESVLATVGEVRTVDESLQDAVTAVSGSGPAYVFLVAEAMIDAGVMLGLTRPMARDLAVQTLVGASAMLASGEHPAVLRENVTSPGGTTAAALHVLESRALRAAFADAMRACRDRSAELA
jgi:pyrroline-5-carboxylate reductase